MKTRIIYPDKLWFNKDFHKLGIASQLLAIYLVTNDDIGLSPFYEIKDLKIMFTLKMTEAQLEKSKKDLIKSGLYDFYREWVLIKNNFSYCDYFGRDRVMKSKEIELNRIPTDVSEYFKGLKTGYEGVSNPSINHIYINNNINTDNKYNNISKITDIEISKVAEEYGVVFSYAKDVVKSIDLYCKQEGKNYKDYYATLQNWIRRDIKAGKAKIKQKIVENGPTEAVKLTDEQRERSVKASQKVREQISFLAKSKDINAQKTT